RVVGRRAIEAVPEGVPRARAGGADVRVAVVPVDAPRMEDTLQVEKLVARPAEGIHHLLLPSLHERLPDAPGDVLERVIPRHEPPLATATRADAAQRIPDPLGIGDLVQRRGALRAVPAPAARVLGIALELLDAKRLLVDIRQEPARSFAVEADRGNQL